MQLKRQRRMSSVITLWSAVGCTVRMASSLPSQGASPLATSQHAELTASTKRVLANEDVRALVRERSLSIYCPTTDHQVLT